MSELPQLVPPTVRGFGRRAGRVPFAFGRRFFLLLLIGLVWLGPAWNDPRYLYAMLLWDVGVAAAWTWDLRRLPSPALLDVARRWNEPVQLNVEAHATLELQNRGTIAIVAQLTDDAPASFQCGTPQLEIGVANGSEEPATATYAVRPGERGDAKFGSVYLRYHSALNIAERWAVAPLAQTVRVYPNLEESKRDTIYLIRSRQIAMEKRHQQQRGQGREFESLREYRQGDEWRDICWSATARRGKLISQSHRIERSQTVWMVLDAGRLLRARVMGLSKLDYAAAAALALAQVALYSGDRVAMLAYGRRIQQRLPAGRGSGHVRALLEGLAQIKGEELEADHQRAAEALLTFQKRRSLVVWLTDLSETPATPDVIESVSRLAHRHLVLFTVIGQPELRGLLRERPVTTREMFRHVAAQEIVQRREILLRTLRQQGVLTLEVDPGRLSAAVVNEYLGVKERSLV
jgi:uncharacterized protein (DUF58 family)